MEMNREFWNGKSVLLTGQTGFKGAWLSLWLHDLDAEVTGYALDPPTDPSLYRLCSVDSLITSVTADIRDRDRLREALLASGAEVVIHMAAQALVRESYCTPAQTYDINVMGTVNLLDAVRTCPGVKAVVIVTTDKCYENREWIWSYRENDPLGGCDPYSSSKACAELVTSAYRSSFFNPAEYAAHGVAVASARAGNVIGGGDWAADRLVPDCIRSILKSETIRIRSPQSIRPWQHVLEPLQGYLLLAQKLFEEGPRYAQGWNFGPDDSGAKPVEWVVKQICREWGGNACYEIDQDPHPHEAHCLKLDSSKARTELGWHPRWSLKDAIESIVHWTRSYRDHGDLRGECLKQIREYSRRSGAAQNELG